MLRRNATLLVALLPLGAAACLFFPALSGSSILSFRDQSDFFLPVHLFTVRRLIHGELPLWNDLSGNGESWIGAGQSQVFYPPSWLFAIGSAATASGAFLLFHLVAAFLLFFAWRRERSATRAAAAAGAGVFALSGAAISLSAYWNHFAGYAWLPGVAWAAERGLKTRAGRGALAACLGLSLLAGSPEMALFSLLAAALVFAVGRREDHRRQLATGAVYPRRWGHFAAAAGLGIALGSVEVLPILDTLRRAATRPASGPGTVSPRQLLGLLATPASFSTPWLPTGWTYLQALYVSVVVAALAGAAFLLRERRREKLAWLAVGIGGLAAAMVPFDAPFRYPAKLAAPALLALGVLAGEGCDGLRFCPDLRRRRIAALAVGLAGALGARFLCANPAERWALLAVGVALAAGAWASQPWPAGVAFGIGAIALCAHLTLAVRPLVRFAPLESWTAPPKAPLGKVLTSDDGALSAWSSAALPREGEKVRREVDALQGYINLPFGVAKARSASALPSLEEQLFAAWLARLRDPRIAAAVAGCAEIRFPLENTVARVRVAEPLGNASFFFSERAVRSPIEAMELLGTGRVDYRRTLLLENPREPRESGRPARLAMASLLSRRAERLVYAVRLSAPAWMYWPRSWDPWWKATVDGSAAPIVRADGVFSAVFVPAGDHEVVCAYRPWPFYAGAGISAMALLILAAAVLAGEPPIRRGIR